MAKGTKLFGIAVFAAEMAAGMACRGDEYRYPAELPVKSLKLEMRRGVYYSGTERHVDRMVAERVLARHIKDSLPFSDVKLHVRLNDGSDLPVTPSSFPWTRDKRFGEELISVDFWWTPDIPGAQAGESYPCYISYAGESEEEGGKPWATREFSLKIGGSGRHMRCGRCFSVGMAPKVTLAQTTGRRMENLMGGTNTTFERGSMERNIAGRMEAFEGKTNTVVRFNTLEQVATNRMATQLAGGAHEGSAGSLERSATDRMNILRGGGQMDGKAGSLERSAHSRTQALLADRGGQNRARRLARGLTVYSLDALPNARVAGHLPEGTAVQLVSELTPALVHIRFPLPGGGVGEGAARYAELGEKRVAGTRKIVSLPNGEPLPLVWCPPGRFMMGSPLWEPMRNGDEAQHGVALTHGFWIGQFELTHEQWESVMEPKESSYGRSPEKGLPVTDVSWDECRTFCQRLNAATGLRFRLPTEAEWEYACRAGGTGPCAGPGELTEMAWHRENSYGRLYPTGLKKANAWGVHDMQGNAAEWCMDGYGAYPTAPVSDPRGKPDSAGRVVRGGSYMDASNTLRVARRVAAPPLTGNSHRGFRVVVAEAETPNAALDAASGAQRDAMLERAMAREAAGQASARELEGYYGPEKVVLARDAAVYPPQGAPGGQAPGRLPAGAVVYVMEDLGGEYARVRFAGAGGRSMEGTVRKEDLRGTWP
jgi:formylglycine-generating enzyme required for sulfatase activity